MMKEGGLAYRIFKDGDSWKSVVSCLAEDKVIQEWHRGGFKTYSDAELASQECCRQIVDHLVKEGSIMNAQIVNDRNGTHAN